MTTSMTPKKPKLSPAQLETLKQRSGTFVNYFKPGLKLIELGLIDAKEAHGTYRWTINAEGEALIASLEAV